MQKIKDFMYKYSAYLFIVISALCICGGFYLFLVSDEIYQHDGAAVQSVESDNREARQQIGNATAEINSAQKQLDQSVKRVDRITERTQQAKRRVDDNSKIVRECQDIVDAGRRDVEEARNIFADIDERNKGTGTQADGT